MCFDRKCHVRLNSLLMNFSTSLSSKFLFSSVFFRLVADLLRGFLSEREQLVRELRSLRESVQVSLVYGDAHTHSHSLPH